jgi:hypothetical protein
MFDRITPGSQIPARELRTAGQRIDRAQPAPSTGNPFGVIATPAGMSLLDDAPDLFLGRITGKYRPSVSAPWQYAFEEVWGDPPTGAYAYKTSGRKGTTTQNYAVAAPGLALEVGDDASLRRHPKNPNLYEATARIVAAGAGAGVAGTFARVGGKLLAPEPIPGRAMDVGTAFSFTASDADVGWWSVVLTFTGYLSAYRTFGGGSGLGPIAGHRYRLLAVPNQQTGGGVSGNLALFGGRAVAVGRVVPRTARYPMFYPTGVPTGFAPYALYGGSINDSLVDQIYGEGTLTLVGRFQVTHAGPVGLGYTVSIDPDPTTPEVYGPSLQWSVCPSVLLAKVPNSTDQQFAVSTACAAGVSVGGWPGPGQSVSRPSNPTDSLP